MHTLWQDLRYAARMLARSPGFTAVAVVTLALGIGANTAMFGILNTVLLRPLPYEDPGRLVRLQRFASWPDLQDCSEQNRSFVGLGGFTKASLDYTGGAEPERFSGTVVTDNLFQLFGAPAALGRTFQPGEDKPEGERRVILSHGFWQTQLGGDPEIAGKSVSFSGKEYVVVGVMPPGFQFPEDEANAWLMLKSELWAAAQYRGVHFLRAFGRLKPGVTIQQAHSDLDVIARRLEKLYPDQNTGQRFNPIGLHSFVVRGVRTPLLILLGAVGFVLLIACANVANLLLVRSSARQRELAIRAALGAGRRRIMQQVLTESVLLGLLGAAAGLLVALWLTDLTRSIGPGYIPRVLEIRLDSTVLAFTLGVSLLTATLFGSVPAWLASRLGLQDSLRESGWSATASAARQRLRSLLVVGEVALALILLVGAGLLLRSFYALSARDPGFRPQGVLTANLTLPLPQYRDIPRRTVFFQQVLEKVQALPGVESAAMTTELPLTNEYVTHNYIVEGHAPLAPGTEPEGWYRGVSPDYFRTIGIPLLRGRAFNADDRADTLPVVIINEALARLSFPGEEPLGRRLRWVSAPDIPAMTIVGVVGDVRAFSLADGDGPAIYVPFTQERHWWRSLMNLTVRTSREPHALVPEVKHAVVAIDPNLPVAKVSTLEQLVAGSLLDRRYQLLLLGLFASLALVLASVGIYGVLSYAANRRTHEIGIRLALGAQTRDILRLVLGHGLGLTLAGVGFGLVGALALTRLMASLLFEVQPTDPLTFAAVSLLLTAVALLACYIPARRATRVDPMTALRYE